MKKTLIALMALAGVAMADDYTGTFDGKSFVTSGNLTLSEITCTPDSYKTPSYLGEDVPAGTTYIAPDINMKDGSWTLSAKITNNSEEAITLNSVTFDAFMFTGAGVQHENDGKSRQVSFTLGGDLAGAVTKDFTGNVDNTNFRDTDADAIITLNKPVTINADGFITFTLTVANGGTNGGSFVGLKGATFSTPTVPEPTTATLSLLALAGLAARRRRR